MAEAVAAPLSIAFVQWSFSAIRKLHYSHPKRQLRKWRDRVAKALKEVEDQHSRIKPSDMELLLEAHEQY
jgi:hypothetical protein